MDREICDKMEFRSIFNGYQIIKVVKMTDKFRILQGFDIKTGEDVLIKIVRSESRTISCCSAPLPGLTPEKYKMLAILNLGTLPKILLNKKIQNYQVIIQTTPKGTPLDEYAQNRRVTERNALKIFTSLFKTISNLTSMKIRMSDLSMRQILVDDNCDVKIQEIDWIYFDESMGSVYEERQIDSLVKIFKFILSGGEHIINLDIVQQVTRKIIESKNPTFLFMSNILEITTEQDFREIIAVDPLVLNEIKKLEFTNFDQELLNSTDNQNFFIYNLVDRNVVRSDANKGYNTCHALSIHLHRVISQKGILNINRVERSILRAVLPKEEDKVAVINKRMGVIQSAIQHKPSLKNLLRCGGRNSQMFVEVQLINSDGWHHLINAMQEMRIPMWENGDNIDVRDYDVGLSAVMRLKRHGGSHFVVFGKERGREIDFVHLVSEIVEMLAVYGEKR